MLLSNRWVNKGKNQKYLETNENGNTTVQNLWDTAKAVLRGKCSDTGLHQETRKSQINNLLTLHLKKLGKKSNQRPELVEERK